MWDVSSGLPIAEPIRHQGSPNLQGVEFSPDGRYFKTRGGAPSAYHVWPVPPDAGDSPAPAWLLRLATICASKRLTDEGEFVSAADEVARIDEIRRELATLPDSAPFVAWGRWFLTDKGTQSIAPGFTVTREDARKLTELLATPDPLLVLSQEFARLNQQQKFAEAEEVARNKLALVRAHDGPESKGVSDELLILANLLIRVGKFAEAEAIAWECLALREKLFLADDWKLSDTRVTLAQALLGQKRNADAEPLLVSAYDGLAKNAAGYPVPPVSVNRRKTTADALVRLYESTNQPEKAAEWSRKSAETAPAPAAPGPNAPPPPKPNP